MFSTEYESVLSLVSLIAFISFALINSKSYAKMLIHVKLSTLSIVTLSLDFKAKLNQVYVPYRIMFNGIVMTLFIV